MINQKCKGPSGARDGESDIYGQRIPHLLCEVSGTFTRRMSSFKIFLSARDPITSLSSTIDWIIPLEHRGIDILCSKTLSLELPGSWGPCIECR